MRWTVLCSALAGCAAALALAESRIASQHHDVAGVDPTTIYDYRVVNVYPHDPEAFTQGLIYRDGFLYESTGLNGRSTLRKVRLDTGEVVQRESVDKQFFAEGLTDWGDQLIQLTWATNVGFVYDLASFRRLRTFAYRGEGWGLTRDDRRLIMSDGTSTIRFLNPNTFQEMGSVVVRDDGREIDRVNELEMVRDALYANVWHTDRIAIISPGSGRVTGWIDLQRLLPNRPSHGEDVLNGIAYDRAGDRLFVTGKLWPSVFEIRLVRRSTPR